MFVDADGEPSLLPGPGEQCIALTETFSLLQKRKGHRYSVDDMLVAHLATTWSAPTPGRVLDLGCGLGSVLLIVAWAFPETRLVGLEVLDEHLAYARRNVRLNGCRGRVRVVPGDLRDRALVAGLGPFDFVTGSPPYFVPGSGTPCADPARTAAHFELRGGVEAYARAAATALAPEGLFFCCAPANPPERARAALEGAGLSPLFLQPVVPRAGRPPFLVLLVARPRRAGSPPPVEAGPLVLRDAQGRRSLAQIAIREWTGIPCPDGR